MEDNKESVVVPLDTLKETIKSVLNEELTKQAQTKEKEDRFKSNDPKIIYKEFSNILRDQVRQKAMSFTTGVIPEEWLAGLFLVPPPEGVILNEADVRDVGERTIHYNEGGYAAAVYDVTGGGAGTDSQGLTLNPKQLNIHDFEVIVPVFRSDIEDATFNIGGYVAEAARNAFSRYIDTQGFTGTGTPFTGVFNTAGVNAYTLPTGNNAVTKFTIDHVLAAINSTPKQYRMGAKLFWHSTVTWNLAAVKGTTAYYVYGQPSGEAPLKYWGYPVVESELLPDITGGASTKFAAYMNPKRMIVARRLGEEVRIAYDGVIGSLNLTTSAAIAFIFRYRYGFGVNLPGAITVISTSAT